MAEILKSIAQSAKHHGFKDVIVAVSGGADSISLAFALKEAGLNLRALHCNFHLRGDESMRDQIFVENFCRSYSIPLTVKDFDTIAYIDEKKGVSIEMACRQLRYEWFEDVRKESGAQRVVTGHNADDNIETFFLNLLRGSGTRGLSGMQEDNGKIWRPLISIHRNDILDFCSANNLEYITDSTNLKDDFRRNFLRNRIIPLFKEQWKGFDTALDKSLEYLKDENFLVEEALGHILKEDASRLPVEKINEFAAPRLLVRRFIEKAGPYTTTASEILEAIKANKPHIRRWRLKKGWIFLRNGNLFIEMIHGESCS